MPKSEDNKNRKFFTPNMGRTAITRGGGGGVEKQRRTVHEYIKHNTTNVIFVTYK